MDYFKRYLKVAPLSHSLWRTLEAKAVSSFELHPPILDLGCGFGEFAGVFADQKIEVGIDISIKDLISAAKNKRYQKVFLAYAKDLPFEDCSFNTVLAISSLEHMKKTELVFLEALRVLQPGGLFIFTVPTITLNDILLIPNVLKRLKMKYLANLYLKIFHRAFKHENIISQDDWIKITKKSGFKIIHVSGTVSKKQVVLFELGLPFALPTQLVKFFFQKRLLFSPNIRVVILNSLFKKFLEDHPPSRKASEGYPHSSTDSPAQKALHNKAGGRLWSPAKADKTDANIIIVAKKPET